MSGDEPTAEQLFGNSPAVINIDNDRYARYTSTRMSCHDSGKDGFTYLDRSTYRTTIGVLKFPNIHPHDLIDSVNPQIITSDPRICDTCHEVARGRCARCADCLFIMCQNCVARTGEAD
jgi:hypothetical protein